MRVLIVEDSALMGKALEALLLSQGHQVLWIIGMCDIDGFVGMAPNKQPCKFDPNSFQVALVDGQIYGIADKSTEGKKPGELCCRTFGPALVKALAARGVACVGISSDPKINTTMLENGAKLADNKAVVFVAMVNELLKVEQTQSPDAATIRSLSEFSVSIRALENKPMRDRADAYLAPFMQYAMD